MNREDKLYVWAALFLILASCFIISGAVVVVLALGILGVAFALWGYSVEVRNGQ